VDCKPRLLPCSGECIAIGVGDFLGMFNQLDNEHWLRSQQVLRLPDEGDFLTFT
jgi:hypothetical protein